MPSWRTEGEKRAKVLERTRRECVAEMILEPISDFHSEDYPVAAVTSAANAAEWVKTALQIEAVAEKFYSMASAKVTVPEVARILKKVAKQHSEQVETLGRTVAPAAPDTRSDADLRPDSSAGGLRLPAPNRPG